jgi:hypothetical protein
MSACPLEGRFTSGLSWIRQSSFPSILPDVRRRRCGLTDAIS